MVNSDGYIHDVQNHRYKLWKQIQGGGSNWGRIEDFRFCLIEFIWPKTLVVLHFKDGLHFEDFRLEKGQEIG